MKTVPAIKPTKYPHVEISQLWLAALVLIALFTSIWLARAPIMPRSTNFLPPSLTLAGTVISQLSEADNITITDKGFELIFQSDSLNPIGIYFSTTEAAEKYLLDNEAHELTVSLLDNGKPYLNFNTYTGEVRFNNGTIGINAILKSETGQPLLLNGKLELDSISSKP